MKLLVERQQGQPSCTQAQAWRQWLGSIAVREFWSRIMLEMAVPFKSPASY